MKQYAHIRFLATAALALSIGLVPLSTARADNGSVGTGATAAATAANKSSSSPKPTASSLR